MSADREQRRRALDPERSFIVQAPAGSGKTEVLTQRFLRLLANVSRPERVLAITFTRKATQEMRTRITKRLAQARRGDEPEAEHDRQAVALAHAVLARDREKGWNLLHNPGRLRITTIDGLCMQLLSRDPAHGARWTGVRVLEDSRPLHREAVRRLFADIDTWAEGPDSDSAGRSAQDALVELLVYLGGDARQLEELLVDMLKWRSMWQRHLNADSVHLAQVLRRRQSELLDAFVSGLGRERMAQAMKLAGRLGYQGPAFEGDIEDRLRSAVMFARQVSGTTFKPYKPASLKRFAFPEMEASETDSLEQFKEIYSAWHEDPQAVDVLERTASSPPLDMPVGSDALPSTLLDNARSVLKLLLVELEELMAESGEADFPAITDAALASLGSETEPAEALLAEDARIEHILMDEFQDTSYTQFSLLRRLTAGWQAGDGRSLFLVGDPMQSIYRFREANVGFFNDVVQRGRLGQIPIEALSLTSNFRSRVELIDWFNATFADVFPARDEIDSGAVSYTPVAAEKGGGGGVFLEALPADMPQTNEAVRIASLVREALDDPANESIAILVRARGQVQEITAALSSEEIAFEAVRMERLAGKPMIQDLRILVRALVHPMDRIAWIALLRAPWCGLRIAELHRVVGDDPDQAVLDAVAQALKAGHLDGCDAARLKRVHTFMTHANTRTGCAPVSTLVELCWRQLGGPLSCRDAADHEDAEVFFEILEEVERSGGHEIIERLEEALAERYAASRPARVKIMTIHNAKGLEFDVVIVPGLQRAARGSDASLIALQEFLDEDDNGGVLMAPITPKHLAASSLYRYLNAVDAGRSLFEDQRVLYVACTRARRKLHLLASVTIRANGEPSVRTNTFLDFLEDAFRPQFEALQDAGDEVAGNEVVERGVGAGPPAVPLVRLRGPLPEPDLPPRLDAEVPCMLRDLPDGEAVALGTVLHRWLELIHDHPAPAWDAARIEQARPAIRTSLVRAGAPERTLEALEERCVRALNDLIGDSALMEAITGAEGGSSWSELPMYRREGNGFSRHVIDLLTLDADGGLRIVDYKSGRGQGEDPAVTATWQDQLDRYCELVEGLTGTPPEGARIKTLERVLEAKAGPGGAGV